jgi:hypothetical protein
LKCAIINFFKGLANVLGSQSISGLWRTEFCEQVFQITKQAHLSDILLLKRRHRRVRVVSQKFIKEVLGILIPLQLILVIPFQPKFSIIAYRFVCLLYVWLRSKITIPPMLDSNSASFLSQLKFLLTVLVMLADEVVSKGREVP